MFFKKQVTEQKDETDGEFGKRKEEFYLRKCTISLATFICAALFPKSKVCPLFQFTFVIGRSSSKPQSHATLSPDASNVSGNINPDGARKLQQNNLKRS